MNPYNYMTMRSLYIQNYFSILNTYYKSPVISLLQSGEIYFRLFDKSNNFNPYNGIYRLLIGRNEFSIIEVNTMMINQPIYNITTIQWISWNNLLLEEIVLYKYTIKYLYNITQERFKGVSKFHVVFNSTNIKIREIFEI